MFYKPTMWANQYSNSLFALALVFVSVQRCNAMGNKNFFLIPRRIISLVSAIILFSLPFLLFYFIRCLRGLS